MPTPNFSGTWRYNPVASSLQIPAPDATTLVIGHREPHLSITRTHVTGDRRDTFSLDLTTEGQDVSFERDGVQMRAHASWDGVDLVFSAQLLGADEVATNVVKYALSSDGSRLEAVEQFRSRSLDYDIVWVMDKVPE